MNAYIILQSNGTVTDEFEATDGILNINFKLENEENTESKQFIYKMEPGKKKVKVLINGEVTSFDHDIDL